MLHPLAGVLSAYGMGLANLRAIRQRASRAAAGRRRRGESTPRWTSLEANAGPSYRPRVSRPPGSLSLHRLQLRYSGTDTLLDVRIRRDTAQMRELSKPRTCNVSGFISRRHVVIVDAIEVEAIGNSSRRPVANSRRESAAMIMGPSATTVNDVVV